MIELMQVKSNVKSSFKYSPVPGDICVNIETCGIYIGNGQMVFAPGFGEVVRYGDVEAEMIYVKYPGNN